MKFDAFAVVLQAASPGTQHRYRIRDAMALAKPRGIPGRHDQQSLRGNHQPRRKCIVDSRQAPGVGRKQGIEQWHGIVGQVLKFDELNRSRGWLVVDLTQDHRPDCWPGVGRTQGQRTLEHPLQLTHRIGVPPKAHPIGGGPERNPVAVARKVAGGVGRIQPERVAMGIQTEGLCAQRQSIELRLIHHPIATGRNSSSV